MAATMIGAKGSDVYSANAFNGVGEKMVALNALLTRGISPVTVESAVKAIIELSAGTSEAIEQIIVLAFQTRDIRGGKGERDASKYIFEALLKEPNTRDVTLNLLDLVPEYGCWQDLFKLPKDCISRVKQIVGKQFAKDEATIHAYQIALTNEVAGWGGEQKPQKPKVSLLAKWLPREGQSGVINMACELVPGVMLHGTRMKLYRKRVSAVNKFLQTVEVQMCAKDWREIMPNSVPRRAIKKYMKAFLNEKGTTMKGQVAPKGVLRHPHDPVRMACRQHFQEHFKKTIKVLQTNDLMEMTPQETLRIQLEDKRYDLVRDRFCEFYI